MNKKIHKALEDGIPSFRPILSAIETPTYKVPKFCDKLMQPLKNNEYKIKDSFSITKEVLEFDASLFMASFDIKLILNQLFTDDWLMIHLYYFEQRMMLRSSKIISTNNIKT